MTTLVWIWRYKEIKGLPVDGKTLFTMILSGAVSIRAVGTAGIHQGARGRAHSGADIRQSAVEETPKGANGQLVLPSGRPGPRGTLWKGGVPATLVPDVGP